MEWKIEQINRLISYFSPLLWYGEQILFLQTLSYYNNYPTIKITKKIPMVVPMQFLIVEKIKKYYPALTLPKVHEEPKQDILIHIHKFGSWFC